VTASREAVEAAVGTRAMKDIAIAVDVDPQ
jgi:hypothetical protein